MRSNIVVVGGYGKVGRIVCEKLAKTYPGKVFAAGRNQQKADEFSKDMHFKVLPLSFDISLDEEPAWLSEAKVVVVCIDLIDDRFAKMCLETGIHYVDITANYNYIKKIMALNKNLNHGTGIVSVGLAPGLTNLLALEAVKANKAISAIDISVMLGIGEKHGPAAVEWTLEKMVYAFTNKKRIQFDAVKGTRATYTFPFSDQYTLPSTLNIPKVITRLCFDSSVFTRVVATLRFLGITKLLKRKKVRGFFAELIDKSRVGTDTFAIKIDAHTDSGTVGLSFSGSNQSKLTANVTAIVALSLYENNVSTGVFNIEELFELVSLNDKKLMMRLKDTTIHYAIDS